MIAWFAYLQATPGLVVPHLRDELGLSYLVGGLHVAAFAAGSDARRDRARPGWNALSAGTGWCGREPPPGSRHRRPDRRAHRRATIAATLLMGIGGGLVLATVQATLADHHGALRRSP